MVLVPTLSYEDLSRAASIVEDAVAKGVKPKAILGINPGSEQVRYTAERDGLIDTFKNLKMRESLPTLVDLVSDNGTEKALKNKRKTLSFTLSTETLQKSRW